MLRNDERWVIFMEAGFRWSPAYAPESMFTVKDLAALLSSVVNTPDAIQHMDIRDKDEAVSLDSVTLVPKDDPKYLCLLFSYTNKKGADPGFKNLVTRKNRVEHKKRDEANAASAHLLISLKQKTRKKHHYYPAILEDVTGIGKTKIQRAISSIINLKKKFSFKDEDKAVRSATVRFEMIGLDDEQVSKDASKGRISYFVAIKERRDRPSFDDELDVAITREEVKLKPVEDDIGRDIKTVLGNLARVAKGHGYDKVQVHYVRKDGKNRSITFGTHREDAEDFLIKRIEKVSLSQTVVGQTHDVPCDELVSAMIALLDK